jgi:hypothetical protein
MAGGGAIGCECDNCWGVSEASKKGEASCSVGASVWAGGVVRGREDSMGGRGVCEGGGLVYCR